MDNTAQIQKLQDKLSGLEGKPHVSEVMKELIEFTQQTEDPLLITDKKAKNQSPYKKKKGI
ncbi:G-protein_gamma-like domain [Hexamita inflata]|uniref:G-protein gamma-like domain n=1 Tax=Hexamita inflata TaxID=28002 RepID=A0AA86V2J4_9EUKA|nr:G-protein gamma-like domain [Hexamita inflata]